MIIQETINGVSLTLETSSAMFSPQSLDKGTLFMLSFANFTKDDKVLDLGCGYGAVGIYAAKLIGEENVVMSDVNPKCVKLSGENAIRNKVGGITIIQSDGFKDIQEKDFTYILSNPPYHADFSTAKHFIEKGFNRLRIGGKMLMVTKRRDWYKNKLTAIFGGVRENTSEGYYVFIAQKRSTDYANVKKSKTRKVKGV